MEGCFWSTMSLEFAFLCGSRQGRGIKIATATLKGGRLHYALSERIQPV
jgi:hypothetical protein